MPELFDAAKQKIKKELNTIYGDAITDKHLTAIYDMIEKNMKDVSCSLTKWDQHDIALITYGNSIETENEKPLQTLNRFLNEYLKDELEVVHLLPFFPYSSDDGFSVIDYYTVNPKVGTWKDIEKINEQFDLMVDLVINHISRESEWFQNFLQGKEPGKSYFIKMDPGIDLSEVTRPRSSPLLTAFETKEGTKYVWTTFSNDQVDLDFSNPWVLCEMLRVLFFYIQKGARIIRLDAIAYLWKKQGTKSIHLPETHKIVKIIRELAELIDPNVIILTETNVPHEENLSYFGDNYKEAHMIYQFSLPPLLLHALHSGNSRHLNNWARTIPETNGKGTFLNFTASHDGIGVRPLEGIMPDDEKNALLEKMKEFGGYISKKSNPDGSESPYEINITYFDSLKGTKSGTDELQKQRFLCSQTIMLALKGIPAFYIHSLLATPNDHDGVKKTGRYRSINRKTLDYQSVTKTLNNKNSTQYMIFTELKRLAEIRKQQTPFHPDSSQQVMDAGEAFFAFQRKDDTDNVLWAVANVTNKEQVWNFPEKEIKTALFDLISEETLEPSQAIPFAPYQCRWVIQKQST